MDKAYSTDEECWEIDFDIFLDRLLSQEKDRRDLIGSKYFEGDQIPISTGELFDIGMVLDAINENAYDEIGEWAEDYPDLTDEERQEFKKLIVSFLDNKHKHGFFRVINICKKIITAEDLEEKR
jgi:hypothetical protein